jgi:hypothetical protein
MGACAKDRLTPNDFMGAAPIEVIEQIPILLGDTSLPFAFALNGIPREAVPLCEIYGLTVEET